MRRHQVEGLAVGHLPGEGEAAGAEQRSRDRAKCPQNALVGKELAGQSLVTAPTMSSPSPIYTPAPSHNRVGSRFVVP